MIKPNAKNVPSILWEYFGIIEFMNDNPALYHMDSIREKKHIEVAEYFGVTWVKDIYGVDLDEISKTKI